MAYDRHPHPRHLGRQRQHIPLTITSTWEGGIPKSPLTTNGGAQCHWRSLRRLWHERLYLAAWMGGRHPRLYPTGRQCHYIPLAAPFLLRAWGGEYFPTARPNMPSVAVTRSGHPTAIVEWAACASAAAVSASVNDVLEYWMTYAHPHEKALFKQQTCDLYSGPQEKNGCRSPGT